MKYEDTKDFSQRCEEHPDHQTGMISNGMIQQRLHEEIDELRDYIEQAETQKPVAYRLNVAGIWHFIDAEHAQRIPEECEPLYTALELK